MIAALAFVLISLMNSVLLFRNQYDGDADKVLDYFKNTYIDWFYKDTPYTLLYFLSSYGTCPIEPRKIFHRQIIMLRLSIIISKQMFHQFMQRSRSFYCSTERRTHCLSKNASKPRRTCMEPQRHRYADCNAHIFRIVDDYPNQQILGCL